MALRVVAMGDINGCDIAQEVHSEILKDQCCMADDELLIWGYPLPLREVLQGAIYR